MWKIIARILARPNVATWLICRAMRTPYTNITSPSGDEVYMERYWLFNPYPALSSGKRKGWRNYLPSIRLHYIKRPDLDRHLHDHPWNAHTIILRGGYWEVRHPRSNAIIKRKIGDTAALKYGEYHRIIHVHPNGAWTLFITWRYRGTWGFLVDGKKVSWRKYLNIKD